MSIDIFSTPLRSAILRQDLNKIKKFVLNFTKENASRNISNRGGYQSKDIFENEYDVLKPLFKDFQNHVDVFSEELSLVKKPQIKNIWLNINGYKDLNVEHTHPQSIISGVFYIKTPNDSGDLVFKNKAYPNNHIGSQDVYEYTIYTASSWNVSPRENLLILFPSWLPHEVMPNLNKKQKRISIAFNA